MVWFYSWISGHSCEPLPYGLNRIRWIGECHLKFRFFEKFRILQVNFWKSVYRTKIMRILTKIASVVDHTWPPFILLTLKDSPFINHANVEVESAKSGGLEGPAKWGFRNHGPSQLDAYGWNPPHNWRWILLFCPAHRWGYENLETSARERTFGQAAIETWRWAASKGDRGKIGRSVDSHRRQGSHA